MSRIEKLLIQGMRSFGPLDDDRARIDFVSNNEVMPLTLILGQNGCGKTTIIECLRYITTGECPPGSHGGRSFVHDPKMARENKVSGHVKLQFRSVDGGLYIVSRTIEATQKAKQIAIKTLDATITRKGENGGKPISIGQKCTDMNNQMTIHLGVSKAILNYVIFCHQEDSSWPLDEGSKVKDKFDEIFASAKYKDCLKRIKDVRAKHQEQLRIEKTELNYLQQDKNLVQEKREEVRRKENDVRLLTESLEKVDKKISPLAEELASIRETEESFLSIEREISGAKSSLEHCRKEVRDLEENLELLIPEEVPEEEIQTMKETLQTDVETKKSEIDEKSREIKEIEQEIQSQEVEIKKFVARIGECRSHQSMYLKNKEEFKESLMANSVGLEFEDENSQDVSEDSAIEKIRGLVMNLSSNINSKTEEWDAKISNQRKKVGDLEIKKAQFEEQKKQKQTSMMKSKKESAQIRKQLSELEGCQDKLEHIRRKLENKNAELEKEKAAVDINHLHEEIREMKAEKSILVEKEIELKEERSILDEHRSTASELEVKKSDRDEKRRRRDKILTRRRSELVEIFGGKNQIPENSKLKDRFYELSDDLSSKVKKISADEQEAKFERDSKKNLRSKLLVEIERIEGKIRKFENEVSVLIGDDQDFETELENCKLEVEKARNEVQLKEARKFTNKEFVEIISDSKVCPTCSRAFHRDCEAEELIADLKEEINRIPTKVKSIKSKLAKLEAKKEKFQELLPEKRQYDELCKDLREKKSELSKIETGIKAAEARLFEIEDTKEVLNIEYSTCNELREDILNIDRSTSEIKVLDEKIDYLESIIGVSTSNCRDYNLVKEEEETNSQRLNAIRQKIENAQATEMKHERKLNDLEKEKNRLMQEKLQIESRQQERVSLENKKSELEAIIKETESELKDVQSLIGPLEDDLEENEREMNKFIKDKIKDIDDLRQKLDKAKKFENHLNSRLRSIREYEESNYDTKLNKYVLEHERIAKAKAESNEKKKTLEKSKFDLEKFISNQSNQRRQIDDNLRLRNYKKQEQENLKLIEEYEDRIKAMNVESVYERKRSLIEKRDELESSRMMKKGQLDEMKKTLGDLNRELASQKLSEAEEKFRKKLIRQKCREHVISDLKMYYEALDCAIMKFHKDRMKIINKIVQELWRSTYKGNDIDYIEIKTDESDTNLGDPDKRKTYNYRVVMVKNDTEMEMRGRCSAGQKVLASLIIRLALAETFSSNCGIIALDEPTTNLDRENIQSLAEALSRIVTERSAKSNFQLIVITHDEDLIDQLGRVERVDKYYKLSRNDKGVSIIRKFDINSVEYSV